MTGAKEDAIFGLACGIAVLVMLFATLFAWGA